MIVNTLGIELPVCENFRIKKNRYFDQTKDLKEQKRISIVSGIHGDELEGQFVSFLLCEWLNSNQDKIKGIIDVYPALNSLGIDSIGRNVPFYNIDLNRVFPGNKEYFLPSQIANAIIEEIRGSDIAIDIHSSNIFLREIPQVRMSEEFSPHLLPLAKTLGIDFIWIHDAVTVLEATFAHSMNSIGTKTLVVELGVGMRVTTKYGIDLVEGIKNMLASEGILDIPTKELKKPIISQKGEVFYINADAAGLFVPSIEHCELVKKGDEIGKIVSPIEGKVVQVIKSPSNGILFTLRAYPIVYEGSLIARIFGENV